MSNLSLQLTLAGRYLRGRRLRTGLTTLAVIFGVMIIFGLNGMIPAVVAAFEKSVLSSTGQVDLTVSSTSGGTFKSDIARRVSLVPGVAHATPILREALALPPSRYRGVAFVTVVGVDPQSLQSVQRYPMSSGRFILQGENASAVLPASLASKMGVRVGGQLELPAVGGTQTFRIVGFADVPAAAGAEQVFVPLAAAQRLFGESGRLSEVDAAFTRGADRSAIQDRVRRELGGDYAVGGIESGSQLLASLQVSEFSLNMFGVFALAMGAFIILNTFRTVVSERRHDIGMLRAIGATRGTILGMFVVESVLQGALGTGAGIAAGWLLGWSLLAVMNPLYESLLHVSIGGPIFLPSTWSAAIILGMGVTVLAAIVPAFAAARVTPLEALRPQLGEVYEKGTARRGWAGVVTILLATIGLFSGSASLVGVSAVVFMVGMALLAPSAVKPITDAFGGVIRLVLAREGDIAKANVERNPGRAGVTASAVMISMAIVIALIAVLTSIITGFTAYLNKSLGSTFLVMPQSIVLSAGNIGADPQMVSAIRRSPGVGDVASLRLGLGKLGDTAVQVIGIDPVAYPKVASFEFSKGGAQGDLGRLSQKGTVMVNGIFAAQHGVLPGSRLILETPDGHKTYRVLAIGNDYLNAKLSTVYTSQDTLSKDFHSKRDLLVLANIRPGADLADTEMHLARILDHYPQFVLWNSQNFRATQMKTFDDTIIVMYLLAAALAIPSLLALLNTLAISVLARTREIGMLRAIGSTRRQVAAMVLVESVLLALIGIAFGILAGIWVGYALVAAMGAIGWPMPFYFPYTGILAAIAIGLLFAVIAALIPARQATRLDVVDALRWE
jgi:putative ABC transport system permease protein